MWLQKQRIHKAQGLLFSQILEEVSGEKDVLLSTQLWCFKSIVYSFNLMLLVFFLVTMIQTFRDIMEALANIGDIVRATQFIGQSSGLFVCSLFFFPFEYNFIT